MNNLILKTKNLNKTYLQKDKIIIVLSDLNIEIKNHSINVIVGKSGAGKSTLLHLLSSLEKPDSGEIYINEKNILNFTAKQINNYRNNTIGFVFQSNNLLSDFNVFENIVLPLKINKSFNKNKLDYINSIMDNLGIYKRKNHFPNQLSGGELQRAAIARALITKPEIIFADEPTGNLDNETANDVIDLFWKVNEQYKTTILIVTHDKNISDNQKNLFLLKNKNIEKI